MARIEGSEFNKDSFATPKADSRPDFMQNEARKALKLTLDIRYRSVTIRRKFKVI